MANTKTADVKAGKKEESPRETVITKGISRTIQTAPYFSLTIQHVAQDTIQWHTIEEREKKQDNLAKLAIKDFQKTHDYVLGQLKLGEKNAFATDHIAKKEQEKGSELIDIDGLDELS